MGAPLARDAPPDLIEVNSDWVLILFKLVRMLKPRSLKKAILVNSSFLGERSIGHLDPGAMSICLLIKTICNIINSNKECT